MPLSDLIDLEREEYEQNQPPFRERDPRYQICRRLHIRHAAFIATGVTMGVSVLCIAFFVLTIILHRPFKRLAYDLWFVAQIKLHFYEVFDVIYSSFICALMLVHLLHILLCVRVIAGVQKTRSTYLWSEIIFLLIVIGALLCLLFALGVLLVTHSKFHYILFPTTLCLLCYYSMYLAAITRTFRYLRVKEEHLKIVLQHEEARRAVKFLGVPAAK